MHNYDSNILLIRVYSIRTPAFLNKCIHSCEFLRFLNTCVRSCDSIIFQIGVCTVMMSPFTEYVNTQLWLQHFYIHVYIVTTPTFLITCIRSCWSQLSRTCIDSVMVPIFLHTCIHNNDSIFFGICVTRSNDSQIFRYVCTHSWFQHFRETFKICVYTLMTPTFLQYVYTHIWH